MKQDYLPVTATYTYFIVSNRLYAFDPLCTYILCEHHNFVFDLKTAKVATLSPREQKLLSRLAKH
jgi:hypothetical protein